MPKFLIEGSYTTEGLRALSKDKASGRQALIQKTLSAVGGKLEGIYYAFGDADVFVICDCPDAVSIASISLAVSASGLIRTKTIPLLTVEETDQALAKGMTYSSPGSGGRS